jgi:DNA-3-methyladenine glycosylase
VAEAGSRVTGAKPVPWPAHLVGYGSQPAESFFARDTATVATELLGCLLVSRAAGAITAGRIVETEAYLGADDTGSHAATRGVTARNRVMFGPPAHAYVYFTYGNHHMLNLVTEAEGTAGAVLIRALEPVMGMDIMSERRQGRTGKELTNGPGKLARALGLDLSDNGIRLGEGAIAIYRGSPRTGERIARSGRIGLSSGHELELRRFLEGNEFVSKGRTGPLRRTQGSRHTDKE